MTHAAILKRTTGTHFPSASSDESFSILAASMLRFLLWSSHSKLQLRNTSLFNSFLSFCPFQCLLSLCLETQASVRRLRRRDNSTVDPKRVSNFAQVAFHFFKPNVSASTQHHLRTATALHAHNAADALPVDFESSAGQQRV